MANNHKDIVWAIADENDQNRLTKEFGLDDSGEDINIGCYGKNGKRYKMDDMDEWDEDQIDEFVKDFKAGE